MTSEYLSIVPRGFRNRVGISSLVLLVDGSGGVFLKDDDMNVHQHFVLLGGGDELSNVS